MPEFHNDIHIFNENDKVDKINIKKLEQLKMPICELIAINSSKKGI